jgi:GntR family transcriptional regulator/MocR family aminotransferase
MAFRWLHELRNEGQEEGCRLRVQGLDQHTFAERSPRTPRWCRGRTDQLRQAGVTRRIVQSIKDQISAGTYGPGDRLPSTRALAAEWGASRSTVTAAYGQLIVEGYLETRIRARPTVARALQSPAGCPRRSADPPARLSAFARRALDGASPLPLDPGPIADFRYGE